MHNQQKDETCGQECGNDSRCKKPKGHDGSCNPLYGMTFAAALAEDAKEKTK